MRSVPFTISEVHGGLTEGHGVAYVEDEYLVLEVQTAFLGLFKKDPQTYQIDLTDLESVRYRKGLWKDKLRLRTLTLDVLDPVPGVQKGELCLHIARKHREALDVLLDRLDLWRAD
jgi:hypothetical protein